MNRNNLIIAVIVLLLIISGAFVVLSKSDNKTEEEAVVSETIESEVEESEVEESETIESEVSNEDIKDSSVNNNPNKLTIPFLRWFKADDQDDQTITTGVTSKNQGSSKIESTKDKINTTDNSNTSLSNNNNNNNNNVSVDPVDPVDPIDPIDPVDPVGPVDPVNPVDPVDPIDPVNPVDPVDPIDPVDPTDPVDPSNPIWTIDPTDPIGPNIEPSNPIWTIDPENPIGPNIEPSNPIWTIDPTDPIGPNIEPSNPIWTIDPENPIGPNIEPSNPIWTIDPENPIGPNIEPSNPIWTIDPTDPMGPNIEPSNPIWTIDPENPMGPNIEPSNPIWTIDPENPIGPNIEPSNPIWTIDPTDPIRPDIDSSNPIWTLDPENPIRPDIDSSNPIWTLDPTDPIRPDIDSSNPIWTLDPTDPIRPDIDSSNPIWTIDPTDPIRPDIDSSNPIGTLDPENPIRPDIDSSNPIWTLDPENPIRPDIDSSNPIWILDPEDPIGPTIDPVIPIAPVDTNLTINNDPEAVVKAMEDILFVPEITTNTTTAIEYQATGLPEFLALDSDTGNITGKAGYDDQGTYTIEYTASAEGVSDTLEITLEVEQSKIEDAMESDGADVDRNVTTDDILERANYINQTTTSICERMGTGLYGENYVDYKPTTITGLNSNWFLAIKSTTTENYPLMSTSDGKVYSYYGDHIGTEFIVSGFIPFDTDMGTELYNSDYSVRMVETLTGDDNFFMNNKTIYGSSKQIGFIKNNLAANGIENNVSYTSNLEDDFDIVVTYDMSDAIVDKAIERQVPIMATYNMNFRTDPSYHRFGITLTLSKTSMVNDTGSFEDECNTTKSFIRMVETLTADTLEFVNKEEVCIPTTGKVKCDFETLVDADGNSANYLFMNQLNSIRSTLTNLDKTGSSIFDTDQETVKLAVLLADTFRDEITYPMSHLTTPGIDFYRSFYADNIINYGRSDNIVQEDIGTFTSDQSVIDTYPLESHDISFLPHELSDTYTTGFYLKPGQTLTVTRTDASATPATLKLNTQRAGSGRIWDNGTNPYLRPDVVMSNGLTLKAGETYTYSSPHGGNIYIDTQNRADDTEIELSFDGVLSYPVLRTDDEAEIEAYLTELETTPYAYTDVETPYAVMHFKTTSAISSMNRYANKVEFFEDISNYLIHGNYAYAGYESETIGPLDEEISSYFLDLGLTDYNNPSIHRLPRRQQFNVDNKSNCAALCSGNPIDVTGNFNPLSFEANHEIGHNLQTNYLRIYGSKSTETSNNIFPQNTTRTYALNNGQTTVSSSRMPIVETLWGTLNDLYLAGTPANENHPLWVGTGVYQDSDKRLEFFLQMINASEDENIYPKMYITSRLMATYDNDETTWATYQDALGFSLYSMEDARAINGNDFMLVQVSYMSGKDMTEFFEGFGVGTSDLAKQQVLANNPTETMPAGMYIMYTCSSKVTPTKFSTTFAPFGEGNTYMDNYNLAESGCPGTTKTTEQVSSQTLSTDSTVISEVTSSAISEETSTVNSEVTSAVSSEVTVSSSELISSVASEATSNSEVLSDIPESSEVISELETTSSETN